MKTNEQLRQDVISEIKWDPKLKKISGQIGVASNEGVITLSGLVDNYSLKYAVERAVQRVRGVKVIAVDIEVKSDELNAPNDTEIASAIEHALKWHTALVNDKIAIKVENGWVYLRGKVNWEFERRTAEHACKNIRGVRGITNNIEIVPLKISPGNLKDEINSAFVRNAKLDANAITVIASGNKITLRGLVRSWFEKEEAEKIAWSSPGIISVDNQISVVPDMV
jgi:osmotically-inducible protein OsmY